jgi:peptidoglycan hydrolase-like protein with peptidoglycan-binding domain
VKLRKIAAAVLAAAPAAAVLALPTAQAQAASYPTCNNTMTVTVNSVHYVKYPAYRFKNSAGSYQSTSRCIMGSGAMGASVSAMQRAIVDCNYLEISVDGDYGPATKKAVERVQRMYGLTDDGWYGPDTRGRMSWPGYNRSNDRLSGDCYVR